MLSSLLERHHTLYDAALALPRVGELHGRGIAFVVDLAGQRCVLRHYLRGGAMAGMLGDRYPRFGPNRLRNELHASEAARRRGVATPAVVCGAWYEYALFRRFDIATAYIPDSKDLAAVLFADVVPPKPAIATAAQLIRSMLGAGLVHSDLNLKNILVTDERAYILDLDRCTVRDRVSAEETLHMRQRFFRSLLKWEDKTGQRVHDTTRNTLREAFDATA